MILSIKRYGFSTLQVVTLLLLFLAGLNIGNKYFYFCFVATGMFILMCRKITLDIQVVALLILSFSWMLFSPDLSELSLTAFIKPFLYPMAYVAGRNFFFGTPQVKDAHKQSLMIPIFVLLSVGPFIHYLFNYLSNLGSVNRNTVDIWSGTVLSATNQAALACMMLGVSLAFLFISTKVYVTIFSVASLVIIFLYNLILSGRTLLITAALIILVCIIYYFVEIKVVERKVKIIGIVLVLAIIIYFIITYNVFGITEYLENSNIYLRFVNKKREEILSSSRTQFKVAYMKNFWEGIFGGCHIKDIVNRYAHDLFLDTYDEAGIFALIAVIYVIVRSFYVLLKCIKNKNIDFKIRIVMLSLYISLYAEFFVEPILQGVPWLFTLFCFIHGVVESLFYDLRTQKK